MKSGEQLLRHLRFLTRWTLSQKYREHIRSRPGDVLFTELNGVVAAGPFRGMRYLPTSSGSALAPKLLGSYEKELHGVIQRLVERRPRLLIDVGCAEGYYAVGIPYLAGSTAMRCWAIDVNENALRLTAELARLNGLEHLVSLAQSLDKVLEGLDGESTSLLMCDVEGDELELIDPTERPGLRACDMLIEVHIDDQGVSPARELERRFSDTHVGEWIPTRPRTVSDAAAARWCRDHTFLLNAVDERRSRSIGWLVLQRRSTID